MGLLDALLGLSQVTPGSDDDWAGSDAAVLGQRSSDEQEVQSFRSERGSEHQLLVDDLYRLYDGELSKAYLSDVVNQHAGLWRTRTGRWPSAPELFQDDKFNNVLRSASSGLTTVMPPGISSIDGEFFRNDPLTGVVPFRFPRQLPQGEAVVGAQNDAATVAAFQQRFPSFTANDILARLQTVRPTRGGTGGAGRTPPVFDRNQLANGLRTMWQTLLLEDPANADAMVDEYVKAYNSFFSKGGSLDFETWVMGKVKSTPKFRVLYPNDIARENPVAYISQYQQASAQTGLSLSRQREETFAGASSGASVAGFSERVSRTQGVDTGGAGFGRRVANLVNQMGVAGT